MSDKDNSCRASNKRGQPCGAPATESGYCYLHTHPEMAARLGRAGGRGNRHVSERNPTPLPPLDSITGVANANAQMIGDLYSGRLPAKIATALAPLLTLQLRALGAEEQEEKFGKLEEEIKKLNEKIKHGSAEELKEPSPALVSGRANAASGFD